MSVNEFIDKLRRRPEKTRKIIFWIILIVIAALLLIVWAGITTHKIKEIKKGGLIKQSGAQKFKKEFKKEIEKINNQRTETKSEKK